MNNKRNKILTYLFSGLIPVAIFLLAMFINKTYPFGDKSLNIYDSFDQYSSILLTIVRGIKNGNIFYSMNGGLGINLYATAAYYGTGILNVFALFANTHNYITYSTIMILVRFACLGLSMCFYLNKKNLKPIYIIALSISYALMGFTATYYYHFIWIDSIILLPLVIYGIEELIEKKKPLLYIISLSLAIISNFYIGYMIVLFGILFFVYKILLIKSNKKEIIKSFIISSILVAMISSFILIPVFFALLTGKTSVYSQDLSYFSFNKSILTLPYSMTPGNYKRGDHVYGHALIYTNLFVFANVILFFFNKSFSKKEKIITLVFFSLFCLSISFNIFNYMWHMFAKPLWFVYRFSFLISFLLIYIATKNLININDINISNKSKIILIGILSIIIELSAAYKLKHNIINGVENTYLGFIICFSLIALSYYILSNKKDTKKYYFALIIILLIDILINTTLTLHENTMDSEKNFNTSMFENAKNSIVDNSFYRADILSSKIVNEGLLFDFYSLDYVCSIRNNKINTFLVNTGLFTQSQYARVGLEYTDKSILNLYGIKYIINDNGKYNKIDNSLSLGFTSNHKIKNANINNNNNYGENLDILFSSFINKNVDMYKEVTYNDFTTKKNNKKIYSSYTFKAENNLLIHLSNIPFTVKINEKEYTLYELDSTFEVNKNDNVIITYIYDNNIPKDAVSITIFNIDIYNSIISKLKENTDELYNIKTNSNSHIIDATIDINKENTYLFTTIGYEKGMKIYLDGKKVKPDILFDAVIGLDLSRGTHHIIIDYIPKGFYEGLIISFSGILLSIIYLRKTKKHFL